MTENSRLFVLLNIGEQEHYLLSHEQYPRPKNRRATSSSSGNLELQIASAHLSMEHLSMTPSGKTKSSPRKFIALGTFWEDQIIPQEDDESTNPRDK